MRAERVLQESSRVRAQAAGQTGLVTRPQALAGGIGDEAIRWAVGSGRWVTLHPGVYLTTPGRDDWEVRAVAALLFVGVKVALAGPSAALAWGLDRREPGTVHVVVPAERRASVRPGIDGRLAHDGWGARVRDGIRDRSSARAGRLTVRAFWTDVAVTPCALAVEVADLLRVRGWQAEPCSCRRRGCLVGLQAAA